MMYSSSSVIVHCSYCSMIDVLNLRTKTLIWERGSSVHNHDAKVLLSSPSFQCHGLSKRADLLGRTSCIGWDCSIVDI